MDTIQVYRVDGEGIDTALDPQNPRAHGFSIIFQALDDGDAVRSAARWVKDRCLNLNLTPACVKVSRELIGIIKEDGVCLSRTSWTFLEWKHDTSYTTIEDLARFAWLDGITIYKAVPK